MLTADSKWRNVTMETSTIKENKLKTILMFSVPSIIAMLLQTAITITDGYFTGNYVGENALAAINLGLPVLYFYLGVGLCRAWAVLLYAGGFSVQRINARLPKFFRRLSLRP